MKHLLLALGFTILLVSGVRAANVDTFGIGSKATALGGAFSAQTDDPFAVHYNPAGLVHIARPMVSGGVHMIDPQLEVHNYHVASADPAVNGYRSFDDDSPNLYVPHLGFAMPLTDRWAAGLALYVPYGLDLEWSSNPAANPAAYNCFHSYYGRMVVTPAAAYRIDEHWSIGFGVVLGRSETGIEHLIYNPLVPALHGKRIKAELEDDFNHSFNIGVLFQPVESVSLGLTYRSEAKAEFEGDIHVYGVPGLDTDISMDSIDHPQQIQLGVCYQPLPVLSFEVDLVWTEWSVAREQLTSFDTAFLVYGPDAPQRLRREWDDTLQVKVGIEWQTTDILALRLGYFYDPSPIPEDSFDVLWPDGDKKTYSLGFGLDLGDFTIDGVFQYIRTEADRQIGGESVNLNHTYGDVPVSLSAKGELWGAGLTLSYHF